VGNGGVETARKVREAKEGTAFRGKGKRLLKHFRLKKRKLFKGCAIELAANPSCKQKRRGVEGSGKGHPSLGISSTRKGREIGLDC